ncbi:MAG: hypothetical protein LQ342_007350 [Letrouitia transgressa]|nr:MAG: hypothetical protein LQ342_007350 [Letrouitia transgressa]
MDVAYDHIQEEVLPSSPTHSTSNDSDKKLDPKPNNLNREFQEAYKSFSASPWGARLGGFFSDVKKQGESYYKEAQQEATAAGEEALRGFSDLRSSFVNRARSMSAGGKGDDQSEDVKEVLREMDLGEPETKDEKKETRSESEALRESEGLIARFRSEASKRLKEVQKAEDAADEALLKFGANIRNFLRDAVTIAPPSEEEGRKNKDTSKILFESKDREGKRVIHSTRFDAQLHAIHSAHTSFTQDPDSPEWETWKSSFDVEKKTNDISSDLDRFAELRRAMEKLVPEKVEYAVFWMRYYFLRMVVETDEKRRKEMLKGAALDPEEPVSWDDDSDSESSQTATPQLVQADKAPVSSTSHSSTTTIQPTSAEPSKSLNVDSGRTSDGNGNGKRETLKPSDAHVRRSQDQNSQPDSDASYDLVSGATSRAPGSPKKDEGEGSDEEGDWE